jgi:hypothetical protein
MVRTGPYLYADKIRGSIAKKTFILMMIVALLSESLSPSYKEFAQTDDLGCPTSLLDFSRFMPPQLKIVRHQAPLSAPELE